ncbi:hypothetical protein RJ641_028257 [Dillenia turbinata]|uniref:Topoisomerase 6 subunit A/Spo11 TOPRIM domain-containing protein n=1 Tax=Dillenia turbinata TaxID=194707 RepID=A0AAN8VZX7_9MAGN
MRLTEDRFYNRFPCIIVPEKGQPDVATRLFLRKMKMGLSLAVLALVDSDPNGLKKLLCELLMIEQDIKTGKDLLGQDFVEKNPRWVKELNLMV